MSRSIHRLSVLIGRHPDALMHLLSRAHTLPLPRIVPVGSPGQMLRHRPDIRAAELNLAESTDLVGVAIANLFPKSPSPAASATTRSPRRASGPGTRAPT